MISHKRTGILLHILKNDLVNKRLKPGVREELEALDALISVRQGNGSKCNGSGICVQSGTGFTKPQKV
jgi:hypothetical protein